VIEEEKRNEMIAEQFKIPEPFKAWCHACQKGFMSIKELQDHLVQAHRVWKG
jgi:hypothetical protein